MVHRAGGFSAYLVSMALLTLALPAPGAAQERDAWLLPLPASEDGERARRTLPATTIATPTAYGADFGEFYAGLAYQERTRTQVGDRRYPGDADAALFAGFGLGDRHDFVGLDVTLTSYSTVREPYFDVVFLSFELHRVLLAGFAAAVGWENAVQLGPDAGDGGSSVYGVLTHSLALRDDPLAPFAALVTSVGVGNGRFRSLNDILEDNDTVGVFGSAALRVLPSTSLLANWTGHDLALGASVAPFPRIPLAITAGFRDILGDVGEQPRFVIAIGFGYSFEGGF